MIRSWARGVLLALAAGILLCACGSAPTSHPQAVPSTPPGYRAEPHGRFGWVVPAGWHREQEPNDPRASYYRDPAGRLQMYASPAAGCGDPEQPESRLPGLVQHYVGAYRVVATTRLRVPNAAGGWRYDLSDAGGGDHTFVNVWVAGTERLDASCDQELDLVINAAGDVTDTIVTTLTAAR
jgi:hypothetical protein